MPPSESQCHSWLVRVDFATPGSMASLLQPLPVLAATVQDCKSTPSRHRRAATWPAGKCWADSLPNLKPTPSDMHANCIRTGIMMALT